MDNESPNKKKRKLKLKELLPSLSKEELLRRVKFNAQELKNIDQGEHTDEIDQLAAALVTTSILRHKEKDVKSYVACCLADVLRIYAPDPPYNEIQLKDIFSLLVRQLKGLQDVSGPLYGKYFYILESLALVKTFNACLEIDAQEEILNLFKLFFTIISDQHNIRVKQFMLDIMVPLIQESESLPQEIIEVILIHLVDPRKSKFRMSYRLACDLLDRCSSSVEPYIQLFFNHSFILGGEVQMELQDRLYDLLYELFKVNRNVLLSVLPQLEFKLKSSEEKDRYETVQLLGRIFEEDDSSLVSSNKALWNYFVGRFVDVSISVRIECVRISRRFICSSYDTLRKDMVEQLKHRILDQEEKVRLETVVAICEAGIKEFHLLPDEIFQAVRGRMRDRKWSIRREAITCVGKIYKNMHKSAAVQSTLERLSWVPSQVLHLYGHPSIDDRLCIERVLHGCIIPVTLEMDERMKRLLEIYHSLDEQTETLFNRMMQQRARITEDFITLLKENQKIGTDVAEDKRSKHLYSKILALSRHLPDSHKSQEHLKKFILTCKDKMQDSVISVVDGSKDCPKILTTVTSIVKTYAKSPIIETLKALLDRACPMLIDQPSMTILLKYIKRLIDGVVLDDNDSESSEEEITMKVYSGLRLINLFANIQPNIFASEDSYETLLIFIKNDDEKIVTETLRTLQHVIEGVQDVSKNHNSCFQTVLTKIISHGTRKQAKYSMRCLHKLLKDSQLQINRIFKGLIGSLDLKNSNCRLTTVLSGLSEIAHLYPAVFENNYKEIIREFVVKKVMVVDQNSSTINSEDDSEGDEWCPDTDLCSETILKMQCIKLLTKWLIGSECDHESRAAPVFRMFHTILENDGDLTGKGAISAKDKSRLRLCAGTALLKLVSNSKTLDCIELKQYRQLSLLMLDSCFEVRDAFTNKLQKYLDAMKLPLDYLAFLVFAADEPSKERRSKVRQMIVRNAIKRRELTKQHSAAASRPYAVLPEYSLPYVIHLLAYHPEFDHNSEESLRHTKDYLWFYLEPILGSKSENYSFLKKLIEKIKQTKDKEDPDDETINAKLYCICDLAVTTIMTKSHTFTLKVFPGKVVLPKKIFIATNTSNTKSYLPENFVLSPKKNKTLMEAKSGKTNVNAAKHKSNQLSNNNISNNDESSSDVDDDILIENLNPKKQQTKKGKNVKSSDTRKRTQPKQFDEIPIKPLKKAKQLKIDSMLTSGLKDPEPGSNGDSDGDASMNSSLSEMNEEEMSTVDRDETPAVTKPSTDKSPHQKLTKVTLRYTTRKNIEEGSEDMSSEACSEDSNAREEEEKKSHQLQIRRRRGRARR